MSWHECKVQRRANRGERGSLERKAFRDGHRRRQGYFVLLDKKTGEIVTQALNGCFGNLAQFNQDTYDDWAQGTRGAL